MSDKKRIVVRIDENLKIKLKIKAIKEQKTMSQIITELIENYLKE